MSATVTQIATAIAAPLTTAGIRTVPYLPDLFTPPVALVGIDDVNYHDAFGVPPPSMYKFTLFLVVSRVDDRTAIGALEGYMSTTGTTSIIATLEADPTLGGVVDNTIVRKGGPTRALTIGTSGVVYATVEFTVEVYAR